MRLSQWGGRGTHLSLDGGCSLAQGASGRSPCDHPVSVLQCLQSLCDLRHSPHFPHTSELDRAVGAAVASMGPEVLLQAVALEIDGTE